MADDQPPSAEAILSIEYAIEGDQIKVVVRSRPEIITLEMRQMMAKSIKKISQEVEQGVFRNDG